MICGYDDFSVHSFVEEDVVECSYVQSEVVPGIPFFSSKVRLGVDGVEEVLGLGELSKYEQEGLEAMKGELLKSIQEGVDFVNQS